MHNKNEMRYKRHRRIRKIVSGTSVKPRLCVFRSLNNIYAQIIDDTTGGTLVAASTAEKDFSKGHEGHSGNVTAAKRAGENLGVKALAAGIKQVVFDRGGYLYHGRVKALADGARKAGLQF